MGLAACARRRAEEPAEGASGRAAVMKGADAQSVSQEQRRAVARKVAAARKEELRELSSRPGRPSYFDTPLASVGKEVRVKIPGPDGGRCRRVLIECVDEADGTVDVVFVKSRHARAVVASAAEGPQEEEATLRIDELQALEACELIPESERQAALREDVFGLAADTKDGANSLFKLRDFEAAIDMYSRAIDDFQTPPSAEALGANLNGVRVLANQGGALALGRVQNYDAALEQADVRFDGGGGANLVKGAPLRTLVRVYPAQMQLQASLYMNRARGWGQLGCHQEAAQDLSVVIGLWTAVLAAVASGDAAEQLPSQAECRDGLVKAYYMRAKGRLARMRIGPARADIKAAMDLDPPDPTAKLLRQLERECETAQKEQMRSNKKIAKEIAKLADGAMSQLDEAQLAEAFGGAQLGEQ